MPRTTNPALYEEAAEADATGPATLRAFALSHGISEATARAYAGRHRRGLRPGMGRAGTGTRRPRTLRFGVEIETRRSGISARAIADALSRAGLPVCEHQEPGHSYGHSCARWAVCYDASCGWEIKTPPLPANEEGYRALRTGMAALRSAGCQVDAHCGMHVHMEVRGMERAAVAAFADSYITRQTTMDRLVARSRRGHHYCHHWDDFRWEDTKRRFLDGQSIMRTTATVNLGPYGRYGTVEFRQHQGTLSGRKAVAWVKMLAGLRQRATDGTTDGLGDGLGFLADLLDNRTAAYLIGRADTLAGAR